MHFGSAAAFEISKPSALHARLHAIRPPAGRPPSRAQSIDLMYERPTRNNRVNGLARSNDAIQNLINIKRSRHTTDLEYDLTQQGRRTRRY
jgi:hypothetical protein